MAYFLRRKGRFWVLLFLELVMPGRYTSSLLPRRKILEPRERLNKNRDSYVEYGSVLAPETRLADRPN